MEGDQLDFEDPSTSCFEKNGSTSQSPTMCPVVLEVAEQELIAEESVPTTDSDENGVPNIEINNVFSLHLVDTCTDQDMYSDESPLPGDWVNDHWTDDPSEHAEDASSANGLIVSENKYSTNMFIVRIKIKNILSMSDKDNFIENLII